MSHSLTYMAFAAAGMVALMPHLSRVGREVPLVSACLWAGALAIRALFVGCVALLDLFVLHTTAAFHTLSAWCVNFPVPGGGSEHVAVGSILGLLLTFAPIALVIAGAAYAAVGLRRASRAVERAISAAVIGPGPGGSTVISSNDVLLGAAGIWRPRVIVSSAALAVLDGQELGAALAHERAHIRRRHRYLLIGATLFRGMSWLLPGGHRALEQVAFQLERDADGAALAHEHDRLALASAICKAALPHPASPVSLTALAGSGAVTLRVTELLAGGGDQRSRGQSRAALVVMLLAGVALTAVTIYWMTVMAALPHISIC